MYTISGTEWPYTCWSAVKNLLAPSTIYVCCCVMSTRHMHSRRLYKHHRHILWTMKTPPPIRPRLMALYKCVFDLIWFDLIWFAIVCMIAFRKHVTLHVTRHFSVFSQLCWIMHTAAGLAWSRRRCMNLPSSAGVPPGPLSLLSLFQVSSKITFLHFFWIYNHTRGV